MSTRLSLALKGALFALAATGCGAAIEPPRDASDRVVPVVDRVKPHDTFWAEHEAAQARRTEPERPRSISLGYVGQGKLAGGVGRDDLVVPRHPGAHGAMTWQEYVNAPTWHPNGHGWGTPSQRGCRRCLFGGTGYGPPAVPVGGTTTY